MAKEKDMPAPVIDEELPVSEGMETDMTMEAPAPTGGLMARRA